MGENKNRKAPFKGPREWDVLGEHGGPGVWKDDGPGGSVPRFPVTHSSALCAGVTQGPPLGLSFLACEMSGKEVMVLS